MAYMPALDLGSQLVEILHLPEHTKRFDIHFDVDEVVTVTCEYFLSIEPNEEGKLQSVLARYRLVEILDEPIEGDEAK